MSTANKKKDKNFKTNWTNIGSIGNSNTININSGLSLATDTTNIIPSNIITTGSYTNNTTYVNYDSSLFNDFSFLLNSIKLSDNIVFENNKSNFLILKKYNLVIGSNKNFNNIESFELLNFESNLLRTKIIEAPHKKVSTTSFSDTIMSLLLLQDETYYINLEKDLYYVFSSKEGCWIKLESKNKTNISLQIKNNISIEKIKNSKKDRELILERIKKVNVYSAIDFNAGYVYAPYVPLNITTNITGNVYGPASGYNNIGIGYDALTASAIALSSLSTSLCIKK